MPSRASSSPAPPELGTFIDDGALQLVEVLGYGGYGVVYRAVDPRSCDQTSYAVKCLIHANMHETSRQRQVHLREIALHQRASAHPNVVTLHRVIEEHDYTWIVMDYCSDGDLFSQILNNRRYLGRERLIKRVFLQLLDAVEYCHSIGIYHRDLKPENVLCFDEGLRLAITDFGLATTDALSDEFRTGSIYHMSPECKGGAFAPEGTYAPMFNDIWSLGIILLNIITGRNPWRSASDSDPTFRAYLQNPAGFLPTVLPISEEVNAVLVRTLEVNWHKRITLPELRRAIKSVRSFYSEDVIFQGSMARCPWEADIDIENDSPEEDVPPAKYVSHWSRDTDSEMVFATAASQVESPWMTCSPAAATWGENSFTRSSSPSPASSRKYRSAPHTPPSTHSMSSPVGSIPSLPATPRYHDAELDTSYDMVPVPAKPVLAINTAFGRTDYEVESNAMVSPGSSAMQTAIDSAIESMADAWDSRYFYTSATSPSKESAMMSSAVDVGMMDMAMDDEDVLDTSWTYSTTDATESVAYMSSQSTSFGQRSSVTGLELNFQTEYSSDEIEEEEVIEDTKPPLYIPYPRSERSMSVFQFDSPPQPPPLTSPSPPSSKESRGGEKSNKGSSIFSPIKSAFLRSFSPTSFAAFHSPRTEKQRSLTPGSMFNPSTPSTAVFHGSSSACTNTHSSQFLSSASPLSSPMVVSPVSPPVTTAVSSSVVRRKEAAASRLHKRRRWFSLSRGKLLAAACVPS